MAHRRGVARSDRELTGQVGRVEKLRVERATLVAEHRKANAKHERQLRRIDSQLATLDKNIGRYYFGWLAGLPRGAAKTIKLITGKVTSRRTKRCTLLMSEEQVVEAIIESGRWQQFTQKIKPNLTALKQDPDFAASVGVRVESYDKLIITTPHNYD